MFKVYRRLAVAVALVLLLSGFPVVAFAEGDTPPETLLGDMDSNGVVDSVDARAILRFASGIEVVDEQTVSVADINKDGVVSVADAVLALRQAANIGGVVIPDKSGDNFLSDDPNNEFIKLIANTYKLDPASLVAIYSVPDNGTNYVLRFKKNVLTGKYEKSVDNLQYVYHIGVAPERKVSYTNGKLILGDHYNCEAAEGVLVFNIVQTTVMEQYPDYFAGVTKE